MNARDMATVVRRCARCGKPLSVAKRTGSTVCKACADKTSGEKPSATVQRRCRRCREPIPLTQAQGICKTCRHGGQIRTDPVEVTCRVGHVFSVQSRHGAVIRCALCWQDGDETWITVRRSDSSANQGDGTP